MTMDAMSETIDLQIRRIDELMAEISRLKAKIVQLEAEAADRRIVLDLTSTEAERGLRAEVERLKAAPPRPAVPPWERRDFRGVPTPAEDPDPPIDWSEPGAGMPRGDVCK